MIIYRTYYNILIVKIVLHNVYLPNTRKLYDNKVLLLPGLPYDTHFSQINKRA